MTKVMGLIALVLLSALLVWVWQSYTATPVLTTQQPHSRHVVPSASPPAPQPTVEASTMSAAQLQAQQQAVAKVVTDQPLLQPIIGDIQTRPEFVSDVEWGMLQAAAQQQPQPSKELTRLVNTLRFHKMLEAWQNSSSMEHVQRQALAAQLLQEVPEQLKQGNLPETEVRELQVQWVEAVESRADAQEQRLQLERQRIHDIKQQP